MRFLLSIGYALGAFFGRGKKETELDEEMRTHIQLMVDDGVARGLSEEEARKEAMREFGNVVIAKEEVRDAWGARIIHGFWKDLKFAWKQLFKTKAYSASILLILGLCVGLNSSIFSGIYNNLVKPFDFEDPETVVVVGKSWRANGDAVFSTSILSFLEIEEQQEAFSSIGFIKQENIDVSRDAKPKNLKVDYATAGVWGVTGVSPLIGRAFTEEEVARGEKVAVLSYGFWKSEYGGARDVLEKTVRLNGETFAIIGVMPRGFSLMFAESVLAVPKVIAEWEMREDQRNNNGIIIIARLAEGTSLSDAQHEMSALYQDYLEQDSEAKKSAERTGENYAIVPAADFTLKMYPEIETMLYGLQGAAAMLLLIGCFNIAGLMLARGASRVPEVGLRMALGAGRLRIAGQMVTENSLLFGFGLIGTVLMTDFFNYIFTGPWMGPNPPIGRTVGTEDRVAPFVFSALVILIAMGFSSLAPVFIVSGKRVAKSFAGGRVTGASSGSRNRLQSFLIVGQISLSCFLLICTGLFLYNVKNSMNKDFGYETDGRMAIELSLPDYRYGYGLERRQFQERFASRLKEAPMVLDAAMSYRAPMDFNPIMSSFEVSGREMLSEEDYPRNTWYRVQPNFHELMGIDLVDGRFFNDLDNSQSESVVIASKSLIRYMGESPAIGATLKFWDREFRVVGIVEDTRDNPHLMEEPDHTLFFVASQWDQTNANPVVMVRYSGEQSDFLKRLAMWIDQNDPELGYKFVTFDRLLSDSFIMERLPLIYVSVFAALSIILTSCGLYGFLSYIAEQKKMDVGIRKAMGASNGQIILHMLKSNSLKVGLGLVLGASFCLLISSGLGQALKEVSPKDPFIYLAACSLLALTSFVAIAIPSVRSAMRPAMTSLRMD
ncbi:MAG: ABC transporter permease [Verrucomicrobiota bacterium]